VGEGEGVGEEGVGEAVRPVVAGPVVEGTGVVVAGALRSGVVCIGGGSYGPDNAEDNAVATTTAASTHAGASTSASGSCCVGCTRPPRAYHKSAANTTNTATNSHQGYPRMNGPTSDPPNLVLSLAPLIEPHPAPLLHRGSLYRGVGVLQALAERVVALV
jgi:hypothetical protein